MAETKVPTTVGRVGQDGQVIISMELLRFLNDLVNNPSTKLGNIGTTLSGVTQARQEAQAAQAAANGAAAATEALEVNQNYTPSGAMTVTTNKSSLSASGLKADTISTGNATISVAGGTPNYSVSVTKVSGADLTPTLSASTLTGDGSVTVSFAQTPANQSTLSVYQVSVTDSAGSPLTESVTIAVSIVRTDAIPD